jgi:hypothetical protein
MHADTQPDWGQRRPLQLQRTPHRVSGAGERDHEAIALALLDRPQAIMGSDDVAHHAVLARNRRRHLIRLGLPQPRGAFDVC